MESPVTIKTNVNILAIQTIFIISRAYMKATLSIYLKNMWK